MITGKFESAVGLVTISIDNNGDDYDMSIVGLGNLQYNFDVTPESVTIDRMLALYSNIRVEATEINRLGDNIYDILYDSLLASDLRKVSALITIKTHDLEEYEFKFSLGISDLSLNEKNQVFRINCKPNLKDVSFAEVFENISEILKKNYIISDIVTNEELPIPSTGVLTWIKTALNAVFDNDFENTIHILPAGEQASSYSPRVYDELNEDTSNKIMFTLLNMGAGDFVPYEDEDTYNDREGRIFVNSSIQEIPDPDGTDIPAGSIFIPADEDFVTMTTNNPTVGLPGFNDAHVINGVSINPGLQRNDIVYAEIDGVGVVPVCTVLQVIDNTRAQVSLINSQFTSVNNAPWAVARPKGPNEQPALDILKDLAGIEGSIFGTGFSRNFYFNRFSNDTELVELDYKKVTEMRPQKNNLFLGVSKVTQLSTFQVAPKTRKKKKRSFWDKLFGRNRRYKIEYDEIPEDPFGVYPAEGDPQRLGRFSLPIMSRFSSVTQGNPRATKELLIEIPAAYPLLSRGFYDGANVIGRYDIGASRTWDNDQALESAITAAGLRSYYHALTSEQNDLNIDFRIQGAFSVKPWQLFSFAPTPPTPEKYIGRIFRISEVQYDLVNDTARIKGYQIGAFDVDFIPEVPDIPALSATPAFQRIEFIPIEGAEGRFSVVATGSSNPVTVKINNTNVPGGFQVSSDNVNFSDELVLNPDGNGRVSSTIFVRFGRGAIEVAEQEPRVDIRVEQSDASQRVLISVDILEVSPENTAGLTTSAIGGSVTSIPVDMFTEVERGQDLLLVGGGRQYSITVDQDVVPTGRSNMAIEEQFVEDGLYAIRQSQSALQTGITVTDRQIVLKAVGDTGRIASVRLDAEAEEQSVINIDADTVNIVGVELKRTSNLANNVGYIQSGNFEADTTGWRIDGNGDAEFSNVTVRGQLGASNIVGNVIVSDGDITVSNGNYRLSENGISFLSPSVSLLNPADSIRFLRGDTASAEIKSTTEIQIQAPPNLSQRQNFLTISVPEIPSSGQEVTDSTLSLRARNTQIGTNVVVTNTNASLGVSLQTGRSRIKALRIASGSFSVLESDHYVGLDTAAVGIVFSVDMPAPQVGRELVFFSVDGDLEAAGDSYELGRTGISIDGASSYIIDKGFQSVHLICTSTISGGVWKIISEYK